MVDVTTSETPDAPPGAPRLVLASASASRLRVLVTAGFDPEVRVSGVDEDDVDTTDVAAAVLELACRKAHAVAETMDAGLVLGCDSMLEVDGVAHGKPIDAEDATRRIKAMRGTSVVLHTGHCLVDATSGAEAADVASTVVRMGSPSDAEVEAYVATGEPLGVAGAFTLEGRSAVFIEGVDGDPSNVTGLSLPTFRKLTARIGVPVTSLWAPT